MRKLFGVLALAVLCGAANYAVIGIPSSVAAKAHVARGTCNIVVTWTDTAATIVRAEVRRRGIIADTAVTHGAADTTWQGRGYTAPSTARFVDPSCSFGRTYRYQVRDSIAANAFSSWSDSAQVVVPTRKF